LKEASYEYVDAGRDSEEKSYLPHTIACFVKNRWVWWLSSGPLREWVGHRPFLLARLLVAASILLSRMHSSQYLRKEDRVATGALHRSHVI
jgi:hypothetical protein